MALRSWPSYGPDACHYRNCTAGPGLMFTVRNSISSFIRVSLLLLRRFSMRDVLYTLRNQNL